MSTLAWPNDFPAIVTTAQRPPVEYPGYVTASVGDKVKCIGLVSTRGNVQVQYPVQPDGSAPQGWIARSSLNIGTTAKIGDPLQVHLGTPWIPWLGQDTRRAIIQDASGRVHKTVLGLITSYWEHKADLPSEPLYLAAYIGAQDMRERLADEIVAGIRAVSPQFYRDLRDTEFTISDIRASCPRVDRDTDEHRVKLGIYCTIYDDFSSVMRLPEMYVGSTLRFFGKRWGEHKEEMEAEHPRGVHYRAAAAASTREMRPLCYLSPGSSDPEGEKMRIVEQVFVDMFQSSSSIVLSLRTIEDGDDEAEGERSTTDGEILSRAQRYSVDKEEAVTLKGLASGVFDITGWPGGLSRPSRINTPFGAQVGLNWKSPLTERMFTKVAWTKLEVPGHFANFRRTGVTIKNRQGRILVTEFTRHTMTGKALTTTLFLAQGEPGPGVGTKVDLVAELKLDGQPSEVPYGLQPTIGFMNDFHEASDLAFRIEWKDENDQWKARYLQMSTSYNTREAGAPSECTLGYLAATGLRAYFLQEDRVPTPEFPWLYNYGIAKIKQVEVDHLSQAIVDRSIWRVDRRRRVPLRRVSPDQIADQLLALGAEHACKTTDGAWSDWPITTGQKQRTGCDFCYFSVKLGLHSDTTLQCKRVGDGTSRRCVPCARFARACAFTHLDKMKLNRQLQLASYSPPTAVVKIFNVVPRLMFNF